MDEEIKQNREKIIAKNTRKKNIWLVSLVFFLIGAVVATSAWYLYQRYQEKEKRMVELEKQVADLKNNSAGLATSGDQSSSPQESVSSDEKMPDMSAEDQYQGWKTYTNTQVGYKLRYPSDWTVKETDEISQLLGKRVKYITLTPPDKKHFVYFGIKEKADSFSISDRSGIGAGDFEKSSVTANILGKDVPIANLVFEKKIMEVFFYDAENSSSVMTGNNIFSATLSSKVGQPIDMSLRPIAIKILESVSIISRTSSTLSCVQNYTSDEKAELPSWKKYENKKYDYSFRYPSDWNFLMGDDDHINLNGNDGTSLTFMSGPDIAFGLEEYKLDSEKKGKVGCRDATISYLSGDAAADPAIKDERRVIVQWKDHVILYSYRYIGASISSDILERLNLFLKTVEDQG